MEAARLKATSEGGGSEVEGSNKNFEEVTILFIILKGDCIVHLP